MVKSVSVEGWDEVVSKDQITARTLSVLQVNYLMVLKNRMYKFSPLYQTY